LKIEELKEKRKQIIGVAKWCFFKRDILQSSKEKYIADLNTQLKGIFSDIINTELGEGIIYDELALIPIVFEKYENSSEVDEHREEIIENIYSIILRYAEEVDGYSVSLKPGAPGESGGR